MENEFIQFWCLNARITNQGIEVMYGSLKRVNFSLCIFALTKLVF